MRALFVDDEREFLELMEKRLSRRGIEVSTAYDGQEGVRAVEEAAAAALGVRKGRDFLLILCVNIVTNPVVNIVLDRVYLSGTPPQWYLIAALEAAAVAVEALLYRNRLQFDRCSPWALSALLNIISYFMGGIFYG